MKRITDLQKCTGMARSLAASYYDPVTGRYDMRDQGLGQRMWSELVSAAWASKLGEGDDGKPITLKERQTQARIAEAIARLLAGATRTEPELWMATAMAQVHEEAG